jgi:hypothetical protein
MAELLNCLAYQQYESDINKPVLAPAAALSQGFGGDAVAILSSTRGSSASSFYSISAASIVKGLGMDLQVEAQRWRVWSSDLAAVRSGWRSRGPSFAKLRGFCF